MNFGSRKSLKINRITAILIEQNRLTQLLLLTRIVILSYLSNTQIISIDIESNEGVHGDLHGATMSGLNVHGWDQLGRS